MIRRLALALSQQQSANNLNTCFNWFETVDTSRGAGEALSVDRAVADGSAAGQV